MNWFFWSRWSVGDMCFLIKFNVVCVIVERILLMVVFIILVLGWSLKNWIWGDLKK